jgi:hypothetical protein
LFNKAECRPGYVALRGNACSVRMTSCLTPCIFPFSTTFELDKIYSARHYKRRFFNHVWGLPGQLGSLAISFSLFPSAVTTLPTCQQDEDPVYHSHASLCHRACNCQHGNGYPGRLSSRFTIPRKTAGLFWSEGRRRSLQWYETRSPELLSQLVRHTIIS